jgi:hypothetical protein
MMKNGGKFIPTAIILALGFIIGVIIFVHTWHSNYKLNQTISVTGSANKQFTSDIGYLSADIKAQAPTSRQAYQKLQSEKPVVIHFFVHNGFNKDDIQLDTPTSYSRQQYDKNGRPTGKIISWTYSQQVKVKSDDVQKIKAMSLQMDSLVQQGISLKVHSPKYFYSNLDSLKMKIQFRAAKNAKVRAQKISKATGQKLGIMRNARMGVLQIRPVNSTQVSGGGIRDASTIQKEIMAVVSAEFQIK